jgi:O-antigen/teichoic acid export membrane protein
MKVKLINLFFSKDALWTNIIKIFSSSMITTLITIGLSPIISRLYSTTAFGIFAIIFATATVLSELVTLKYERAILLPEKDIDSITVFWLSILLSIILSVLLFVPLIVFQKEIIAFHNVDNPLLIFLLPFIAFILASNVAIVNLAVRLKYYNLITSNRIYISIFLNLSLLLLGYLKFEGLGLIISYMFSNLLSSLLLFVYICKDYRLFRLDFNDLNKWFIRYINFPKFYLPSVAVESMGSNIPNFFFMKIIGASFLGNYNMSNRIVSMPLSMIGNAIRTVFNQSVAEAYALKQPHMKLFKDNFLRLAFIGIIPMILIILFGPILFAFVFGNEWYDAGMIARFLAPVFFLRLISSPLSSVLTIYEKLNWDLYIQFSTISILALTYFILYKLGIGNYPIYLVTYNIIYCAKYILEFTLSYKLIKNFEKQYELSNLH